MRVSDLMTQNPACCTPETTLKEVARMMVEHDCGEIPVVDSRQAMRPIGVVTDRDICCRGVAEDMIPSQTQASEVMSQPVVTVTPGMDLDTCCDVMERNQIRRVPVVDENGRCCGIISQADIACKGPAPIVVEILQEVSQPSEHASSVRDF